MSSSTSTTLIPVVTLLSAAVVAVPLLRRGGFGSVLAYFVAGLLIGPSAFGWFTDPQAILQISELGVVMFLFIIGLEMQPQRLWRMRGAIFGLGLVQVLSAGLLMAVFAWLLGYAPLTAFVGAAGFVLSSTAVVAQLLRERGQTHTQEGRRAIAILLFEDLSVVPLLLVVAFLSADAGKSAIDGQAVALALAALLALYATGRWLLNPMFAILAASGAREVLTAGALLVVLGAALLMDAVGISMAMGAFMAGVLLSGSSYRHQIEVDIEPFKGILLGLFFLAVGMSLDLAVVIEQGSRIAVLLGGFIAVKGFAIYAVARMFGSRHAQALLRSALFAQGGEFAFVLYAAASGGGLIDARNAAVFSAVVILSMASASLLIPLARRLIPRESVSLDGIETAKDLQGSALIIGFGRFGQIVSQGLLAQGISVSTIDSDPERIREAGRFGHKVYYGDGTRLDVLRASGAGTARAVLVCVAQREQTNQIVRLLKHEFPDVTVLARAWDRRHAIQLRHAGVEVEVRETFEAALTMGQAALRCLGLSAEEAQAVIDATRRRDQQRLQQQADDYTRDLEQNVKPMPLTPLPVKPPPR